MTAKTKNPSKLLQKVHRLAKGLHDVGAISDARMAYYDTIYTEIPEYSPEQIQRLRKETQLTQGQFAGLLNTTVSSVRQWEIGKKHPGGTARKLLRILETKGLEGIITP